MMTKFYNKTTIFNFFYVLTADARAIAGSVHINEVQVPHMKHSVVRTTESVKKLSLGCCTFSVTTVGCCTITTLFSWERNMEIVVKRDVCKGIENKRG